MQFDPTSIPTTLDAFHLGLTLVALVMLTLLLRSKSTPAAEATAAVATPVPIKEQPPQLLDTNPTSALQLLSLLQQESRFIDFTQEDLSQFSDADIGAAARVVHSGARKVLDSYFELQPVSAQDEDSAVTLEPGFNASENRLTGNVVGEAPFTGTLMHKGWKAAAVKLPKLAPEHNAKILAPAEVEL